MRDGIPELKKVRVTSENKNAFKAPAGSEVREEVTIRRNGRISVKRFAYKKTKSEKEPVLKVKSEEDFRFREKSEGASFRVPAHFFHAPGEGACQG